MRDTSRPSRMVAIKFFSLSTIKSPPSAGKTLQKFNNSVIKTVYNVYDKGAIDNLLTISYILEPKKICKKEVGL